MVWDMHGRRARGKVRKTWISTEIPTMFMVMWV